MPKIIGKDHHGTLYPSLRQMHRWYFEHGLCHISYSGFLKRLDNGWSIQETLAGRPKKGDAIRYRCIVYPSVRHFCGQMGISYRKFKRRLRKVRNVEIVCQQLLEQKRKTDAWIFFCLVLPALIPITSTQDEGCSLRKRGDSTGL